MAFGHFGLASRVVMPLRAAELNVSRHISHPHPDQMSATSDPSSSYRSFVFIKRLLIGVNHQFNSFEILPFTASFDGNEELRLVNEFMTMAAGPKSVFPPDPGLENKVRAAHPVAVLHIPDVPSNTPEDAYFYSVDRARSILLALGLQRDSAGDIFCVVLLDKSRNYRYRFPVVRPYLGNLLTGRLAGEETEEIKEHVEVIERHQDAKLLAQLYRDALTENNPEFMLVKLWQVLALLSDDLEVENDTELHYANGQRILGPVTKQPLTNRSEPGRVLHLLQATGQDVTEAIASDIYQWYAARCAIVHHGSIQNWQALQRPDIRHWAEIAFSRSSDAQLRSNFYMELQALARRKVQQKLSCGTQPSYDRKE